MKEELLQLWHSRTFQIGMDICRILLLVIAVMIFYKLTTEIEAVKLLNNDPCAICMNKTGATCWYPGQLAAIAESKQKMQDLLNINISNIISNTTIK